MESTQPEPGAIAPTPRRSTPAWMGGVGTRLASLPPAPLALAAVAVALLTQLGLSQYTDVVPYTASGFVIAIVLLGLAAFAIRGQSPKTAATARADEGAAPSDESFVLPWRWEVALVAAVFALTAFFRFWHLLSFPPGLWYDEGVNANDAISLIDHDHTRIWFDTVFGRSTLYLYLLALSFKVFGYTLFAIRIVPAVAGLLAVVAFYFLARRLVGQIPALFATALFGVSRWAVVFSRLSWEASIQPVLEIAAVYFLIRGIDKRSRVSFALGGVVLAAGLYTYIAFRMVPIFVAMLLVYVAVSQWRAIRQNFVGIAIFSASFLIVIAPLAYFALNNADKFTERTREVSIFREIDRDESYRPLWNNIKKSVQMLNVKGDGNGRHNLPFRPMVDEVTAAMLVLGLGVSLWSIRNWRKGAIAPWLLLSLVPGALTLQIENPSAIRGIGALPPIFLLVGLAASTVYSTMERARNGRIAFAAVAVALVGWSTAINYHDVFQKMADDPGVYAGYTPEFTQVAKVVASHADNDDVYVTRIYSGHNAVSTLAHGKTYVGYDAGYNIVFPPTGKDVFLVPDVNQLQMLPTLRKLYPNLTQNDYVDQFGKAYFSRVDIPASDVAASHDVPITVVAGGVSSVVAPGRIDREWTEDDLSSGPIDVTWDAYFWATSPAPTVVFKATAPGTNLRLELDGADAPLTVDGLTTTLPFGIGEHHLRLSARIERPGRVDLQQTLPQTAPRNAADWAYGSSLGRDHGFRMVFHRGRDFGGEVMFQTTVPFAVPLLPLPDAAAIEMQAEFTAPVAGTYKFALDGATTSQLLIDDELVVDNGGSHDRRHVEGSAQLVAGLHHLTVQYVFTTYLDLAISMASPTDRTLQTLDGHEVTAPSQSFAAPALVTIEADDAQWKPVSFDGFDQPRSVAVLPDGRIVAANNDKLLFIAADGTPQKLVNVDAQDVGDIGVAGDGRIVALDIAAKVLLILDEDGKVTQRIDGKFASGSGLGVSGDVAYVASPSGGIVYKVTLSDGKVEALGISKGDAPVRASQPSDVAVAANGAIYVSDFEKRTIVKTTDGVSATASAGVGGTGRQVPRLTTFGKLVIVTDPTQSRVNVYDSSGKQRGVYNFTGSGIGAPRPIGIVASPDGHLYVADEAGFIRRLTLVISPETAAQLQALP